MITAEHEFLTSQSPERTLLRHLAACRFEPRTAIAGRPLRLLLAGYSGAGNVGAEMRTAEIRRQISALLGTRVAFHALSTSSSLPPDTLPRVKCVPLAGYLPATLQAAVDDVDAVVACEGSMFKSTFSNVLSGVMACALGGARRAGKLAVGYGAEIGAMDDVLEPFVRESVGDALVLCRNDESLRRGLGLGLRAELGADTAWSFDAASREDSAHTLKRLGWNGVSPIVAVCPINPFWWPVRPFPSLRVTAANRHLHYGSIFFHAHSGARQHAYRVYLVQLAEAVQAIATARGAFVLVVAMERVDRIACNELSALLSVPCAKLVGADYPVRIVVGALRLAALLLSSRFHALVGAMPGHVPSIGVSMDERIANLLRTEPERVLSASSPTLARDIVQACEELDPARVAAHSTECVRLGLRLQAHMGRRFVEELRCIYPDFDVPDPAQPQLSRAWLPRLSPVLEPFLEDDS